MSRDDAKKAVAHAALRFVERGSVVGVGTGSTADHFIDALPGAGVEAAVASSSRTAKRLAERGIRVVGLDESGELPLYVDGADETNHRRELVKGGGGALTREKIVASFSRLFVCIVDASKVVARLGTFPLPVEVVPEALAPVARRLEALGGRPRVREGYRTDGGNAILDVSGLTIPDAVALESELDHVPGVVTCGLFARRPADRVLVATADAVTEL